MTPQPGDILRYTGTNGFKLALVLDVDRPGDRTNVRLWRAVSGVWSQPKLVRTEFLVPLSDEDRGNRHSTVKTATSAALKFSAGRR